MKIDDLKKLPDEEVVKIISARLNELKRQKLSTSAFIRTR